MILYYSCQDILDALASQCKNKEVFLKSKDHVSQRPLKVDSKEELKSLIKKYNFGEPFGIFSSIELYDDPLSFNRRIGWDFVIDLDGDDIEQLKICVSSIAGVLKTFKIESFKIKFSGRRGFHFIVDGDAFNVFKSQDEFIKAYPQLPKLICQFLEASLKPNQKKGVKFDYEIYQPRRLLRLAYSLHEESNLISLPLLIDKIMNFKLENAKPENVKVDWDWLSIKPKFGEAWDLLDTISRWVKRKKDEAPAIKILRPLSSKSLKRYEWIENLLNKLIDDGRHRILWLIIAPYLVNVKGLSIEDAERVALEYLERCNKVKKIEGNLRGLARYYVRYAMDRRLKPLSLSKLREDHLELHKIITKSE
ncbi:MAG: DNA primase noncatalytic subunit PriX [Candidatus Bathyarchaeia archaeon]